MTLTQKKIQPLETRQDDKKVTIASKRANVKLKTGGQIHVPNNDLFGGKNQCFQST